MANKKSKTNQFSIPKSFEMMGNTIEVEIEDTLKDKLECSGLALLDTNRMLVHKTKGLHPEIMYQYFWHEFFHFALDKLCLKTVNLENEKEEEAFVDTMAQLVLQYEKTKKF